MCLKLKVQQLFQQAKHCRGHGAPITAKVVTALTPLLQTPATTCALKLRQWPVSLLEDAVALRLVAGLHYLYLTSKEPALEKIYTSEVTDQNAIDKIISDILTVHDKELQACFEKTPQTNEVSRSAGFLLGLGRVQSKFSERISDFEVLEIGTSGGLNLMMPKFRYTFASDNKYWTWGDKASDVHIQPELRGPVPPYLLSSNINIISAKGCDLHPVDLSDSKEALRMKSFVWVDMKWRIRNLEAATNLARCNPPAITQQDAGKWVQAMLNIPQKPGVCRVLMHSIVWQYLPKHTKQIVSDAMAAAAKNATTERPLAWISVETNRNTLAHEVSVRSWQGSDNGSGEMELLAEAHAHGAWIRPLIMGSTK